MIDSGKDLITELLSKRSSFIELFLTAIVLALGINLVSGSLVNLIALPDIQVLGVGLVLCLIAVLYLVIRFSGERSKVRRYDGFLTYDEKANTMIVIPGYRFSRILRMYLDVAFEVIEDSRLLWNDRPLANVIVDDGRESIQILREAIEYFVLKELSLHLRDYFDRDEFMQNTSELHRGDVPDIVNTNRFLNLFTATLIQKPVSKADGLYDQLEQFRLILPKGSTLRRVDRRKIEIDTGRFKITIEAYFLGVNATIPAGFHRYYLSLDEDHRVTDFTVGVEVQVLFRFGMLLSRSGLEYYRWLDSFLQELQKSISENRFFDAIRWESARTIVEHLDGVKEQIDQLRPDNKRTSRSEELDSVTNA